MLSEETLIVLAALAAIALLALGVLELLWPTRPRHLVRRGYRPVRRTLKHARPRGAWLPTGVPPRPGPARPPVAPPPPAPARREETAAAARPPAPRPLAPRPPAPPSPAPVPAPPPPVAPSRTPIFAARPPARDAELQELEALVETCFELYQARRFADVVTLGTAALGGEPAARPGPSREAAALWSIVALARQGLGEEAGARAALEAALVAAPEADRPTYQRQLAALALGVAQNLVDRAHRHLGGESEERVTILQEALAWLERGQAAAPADQALRDLGAAALTELWQAYEQVVMALIQRQQFRAARRLLREALGDPRFPAARADAFRDLLSGTFSGEIGQLTAQALRSMQEARESEALGSLRRAEDLLGTLHERALPPQRREEVDRRLWWGYNRLGLRRMEAGELEEAVEPLFHALHFAGAGPERREETRAALVRALKGVAEARAPAIRQLADAGDREAAIVQTDRLWALLERARAAGLDEPVLSGTWATARRLFGELGVNRE